MRNLIYILLILLTATTATAQSPTRGGGNNQLQSWYGGFKVIRYLAPPNTFNPWATYDSLGMVWIDSTTTKKLMWHTGVYRRYVASERYVDSLFATAVTGVTQQTLDDSCAAIRADITGGSTDSAVYSTKAYRQKAVDSLNVVSATKVNTTDSVSLYSTRAWRQKGIDSVAALVDATVLPTANKTVKRDANANAYVNNLIQNGTSTAAANGTTAMTLASTLYQELTGSSGNDQTYVLPDATTLTEFTPYVFDNNSDGIMVVNNHTGILVVSIGAGGKYEVRLKDNGSVAGTWDKHPYLPLGTNATTSGIQFTGFVSASGSVTGSNLSGTNTGDQTNGYGLNLSVSTFSVDTATLFSKYTTTLGAGSGISISGRTITATGGGGTVTSVATNTGTGITGGTITGSGTIAADTFLLGTRAWREKLKDSLNINIAGKQASGNYLQLSDTVNNVSTRSWRQKAVDSLNAQDALRVKYTDTSGMLAPYLRTVNAVTATSTTTLTNKRWTARVTSQTTVSATPSINTDNQDIWKVTAQTADITSMTTNLTGTPVDGDILEIQITGTAARAITWGASFVSSTVTLPTTTTTTATLTVILQYYSTSSYGNNKWVCVSYW